MGVRVLMVIVVVTLILGMVLAGTSTRAQSTRGRARSTHPWPAARSSTPLTFRTTFRSDEAPDRVELLTRTKGSDIDLAQAAAGDAPG